MDGICIYGCNNLRYGVGCEVDCRENCEYCYNGNNCIKCLLGYYGVFCNGKCYRNCFNCMFMFDCEICKFGFYGCWCNNICVL